MRSLITLALLAIASLSGPCLGADDGDLQVYGVISKVTIAGEDAVISFRGIGHASSNDAAVQDRSHRLALHDIEIHLNLGAASMHTYPRFRYLEWLKKDEAIALLEKFKNESTEVSLSIRLGSILYSKPQGKLRASRIEGSLISVAAWENLFKESIADFHKDFGVDYRAVIDAENQGADQAADH